ncbi:MAG TPA: NYN domain-containing protein [Blastocatellia bacterium]|nr:NYN domain-containing protein [Blastocatellia bacterium]
MYLIDGNNVIGQRVGWHRDKPGSRRQFLSDLARFAQVKRARLTVVFDGAPESYFPDGSSYRGVKIFYARQGADADARIVEMVERERNRKNLVVVTSDRQLSARVQVCGVRVMRSGAFRRMLDESAEMPTDPNPPGIEDEELGQWLRYFGVDDDESDA